MEKTAMEEKISRAERREKAEISPMSEDYFKKASENVRRLERMAQEDQR